MLPIDAWRHRARLLELCNQKARFPTAYQLVNTQCLQKNGEGSYPLEYRLLSVFSGVYRVESGAHFRIIQPWLIENAHPDCCGGIAKREPIEAAWDAVAQLEAASLKGEATAMLSVGYYKFFDSFDTTFTRDMLKYDGFPPQLADAWHHLQINTQRRIKFGYTFGENFGVTSGLGQGDPLSLAPAVILPSWQSRLINHQFGSLVKMGACVDDRNFRGQVATLEQVYHVASSFDKKAGHSMQQKKTKKKHHACHRHR